MLKTIKMKFTRKGRFPATLRLPGNSKLPGPLHVLQEGDVHELPERYASFPWWVPVDPTARRRLTRQHTKDAKAKEAAGKQISDLVTDPESLSPLDALVISGAVIQRPPKSQ
jgi:hypothetical protein